MWLADKTEMVVEVINYQPTTQSVKAEMQHA